MTDLKALVEFIAKGLVNNPDDIEVRSEQEGNTLTYYLSASSADVGRIIGRQGATVTAIRHLMRAVSSRDGVKVDLRVDER